MKLIFLLTFFVFCTSNAEYTAKDVKCLVCRATIQEMVKKIEKVNPNKKIQVGGFRVDETGNLQQKLVPFARSSMHLSELMENICKTMEDYVKATDKKTGKLKLIKLISDGGGMNPEVSEVDIVKDGDLNQSLNYYCEGIVEEFEDEIYHTLKKPSEDPVNTLCTSETNLCDFLQKDEL